MQMIFFITLFNLIDTCNKILPVLINLTLESSHTIPLSTALQLKLPQGCEVCTCREWELLVALRISLKKFETTHFQGNGFVKGALWAYEFHLLVNYVQESIVWTHWKPSHGFNQNISLFSVFCNRQLQLYLFGAFCCYTSK